MTHRGFSLVEMSVVIGSIVVILGAIVMSVMTFYEANEYTLNQTDAVNNARSGIDFLVRDIRESTYADNGAYPIVRMGTSSFEFYSDLDRDSSVELIKYQLVDLSLFRVVTNATGTPSTYNVATNTATTSVAEYVRNVSDAVSIFKYYDSSGVEITDFMNITDVAFVTVTVIVNINPLALPNEFTLRSSAALRNLKTNL